MKSTFNILILLILAVSLSGCGFSKVSKTTSQLALKVFQYLDNNNYEGLEKMLPSKKVIQDIHNELNSTDNRLRNNPEETVAHMKESLHSSFDQLIKKSSSIGINWSVANIKQVHENDVNHIAPGYRELDLDIQFEEQGKLWLLELDGCLETPKGIYLGDELDWKGNASPEPNE